MSIIKRLLRHGFVLPWAMNKHFSAQSLNKIEAEIANSETKHMGEIRFVVESHLPVLDILRQKSAKKRAIEVFAHCHIWDTEHNNGVLIYLLLADHDFEILGDRGIHQYIGQNGWEAICKRMEAMFRKGEFEAGVLYGIQQITEVLVQHFPASGDNKNELSNKAIVL